jgi:hypothetical protein
LPNHYQEQHALKFCLILVSKDSPFWVLGMFLAVDILFQGINFLGLASAIKHLPSSSKTVS